MMKLSALMPTLLGNPFSVKQAQLPQQNSASVFFAKSDSFELSDTKPSHNQQATVRSGYQLINLADKSNSLLDPLFNASVNIVTTETTKLSVGIGNLLSKYSGSKSQVGAYLQTLAYNSGLNHAGILGVMLDSTPAGIESILQQLPPNNEKFKVALGTLLTTMHADMLTRHTELELANQRRLLSITHGLTSKMKPQLQKIIDSSITPATELRLSLKGDCLMVSQFLGQPYEGSLISIDLGTAINPTGRGMQFVRIPLSGQANKLQKTIDAQVLKAVKKEDIPVQFIDSRASRSNKLQII